MNAVTTELMEQVGVYWPEAHRDPEAMALLAGTVHRLTGIENIGVPFCMTVEAEALGATVLPGNAENEPMIGEYPLQGPEQWQRLKPITMETGRVGTVIEAIKKLRQRTPALPIAANLTGPISLATSLLEPVIFFKAMGKQPALVHEFLNFLTDNLIKFAELQLQAGAQVLAISDPSATGEILGPKRFAKFALPCINRILEQLENTYEACLVHICGNLKSIFKELGRLKTKAISIDSVTAVKKIAAALPEKVIVGNVSTHLLLKGKPKTIEKVSAFCLSRGAGVLSPACGISPATPLVNLRAMSQVVKRLL